jgi:tetratricopeptide (TPR) repeat protein
MYSSESVPSEGETIVREFLKCNEIDLALAYYQDMKPRTVQVLQAIAYYYAEKKDDYESAINYYKEAIELQEKVNLPTSTVKDLK